MRDSPVLIYHILFNLSYAILIYHMLFWLGLPHEGLSLSIVRQLVLICPQPLGPRPALKKTIAAPLPSNNRTC